EGDQAARGKGFVVGVGEEGEKLAHAMSPGASTVPTPGSVQPRSEGQAPGHLGLEIEQGIEPGVGAVAVVPAGELEIGSVMSRLRLGELAIEGTELRIFEALAQ